ncbi:P2Y purinoceptor 1 [Microcaecilia unicolor]|uniref:P2Y purinoceptor 1-like n=1 Tax=Microcaecilia unicolor TaxID=1415580 RepID=A0A6P7YT08_9AMPH|nr:P2Y purinoceptor 1-like [Microcaecilia unicolor]
MWVEDEDLTLRAPNASRLQCQVNKAFTSRFLPAVYLLAFLIGVVANGLGLWKMGANWRKWTSLNVLVLNLGLADLLYAITLPFFVSYYLNGSVWIFGIAFCRLARCLFHLNLYASIGFLACISVQRYLGIVHPMAMMGRFQTLRPVVFLSALVWGWVLIQTLPDLWFSKTNRNFTHCHDSTGDEELGAYRPYTLIITLSGFVMPFLIILACYSRVLAVLRKNTNVDPNLKARSINLVLIVLVLFSVCFFPYHVFRNLNLMSRVWQLEGTCSQTLKNIYLSYQVTRGLACLNSAINPLVYLVTNENVVSRVRTFRERAWKSFIYLGSRSTQSLSDRNTLRDVGCEELCRVSEDL